MQPKGQFMQTRCPSDWSLQILMWKPKNKNGAHGAFSLICGFLSLLAGPAVENACGIVSKVLSFAMGNLQDKCN
jgi:hypothetical protein